ncbi:MAG TPA: hypothetical protein VE954_13425 [Oligoflexus sp.]|uniref:hypothetical protein n=1 Tax=Oligoflexus sp. TaxID=1971216 RepID=UPI002D323071|nr:hypothetical protein [Oligoflexus sp.]HYX34105.1 hypothetical protein [Oligoflexus sp.]
MDPSAFIKHPSTAAEFVENARLIGQWIRDGYKQTQVARELGVSEALVSHYMKVATRWPEAALKVVNENRDAFPPGVLSTLAGKTFSDLRGGEPRRKRHKPSLLATVLAIADRRHLPAGSLGADQENVKERMLAQLRITTQELRQRIRELEAQLQKSQEVTRAPAAVHLSADLAYVRDVLIHKFSARVELDRRKALISIYCGNSERFNEVLRLLLPTE